MDVLIIVLIGLCVYTDGVSSAARALNDKEKSLIKDRYIVQIKDESDLNIVETMKNDGYEINVAAEYLLKSEEKVVFRGFAATMPTETATELKEKYYHQIVLEGDSITEAMTSNLDSVDQRHLPTDHLFLHEGYGAHIYIIDTGIKVSHEEFDSDRASFDYDFTGEGQIDKNGHGTHCAGIAGGKTYGVAKRAKLHAVKVLNSTGTGLVSQLLSGMVWTARSAKQPAVMLISLSSFTASPLINYVVEIINNLLKIPVIVAAGNFDSDACNYSPSSAEQAYTVAASTQSDGKASFSNYGSCVNIHAKGIDITSAFIGKSNSATKVLEGTSASAAHVAGLTANVRGRDPQLAPDEVKKRLTDAFTTGFQ